MQAYFPHNRMFNDVVFEGRNKLYGAYYLRHRHNRYMVVAIFTSMVLFGLAVNTPYLIGLLKRFFPEAPIAYINQGIYILTPPPIKQFVPPPAAQKPASQQPKPDQVQFVDPLVSEDDDVVDDEAPPTLSELDGKNIGTETTEGDTTAINQTWVNEPGPVSSMGEPVANNTPFLYVEQMPQFKGGEHMLLQFLIKNIKYPTLAREEGIEGRVIVQFVVTSTGQIENVKILKGIGGGCDQEASRVVKSMPLWIAGKHNGRPVDVTFTLPIVFDLR